jgi:hypothetical protein
LKGGSKYSFRPVILLLLSDPLDLGKLLWLNYAGRTDETVKAQQRLLTGNPGMDGVRFGVTPKLLETKKNSGDWLSQKTGMYSEPGLHSELGLGARQILVSRFRAISRGRANAAEPFWNGGDTSSE